MKFTFLILLLFSTFTANAQLAQTYQTKALQQKLYENKYWKTLLHYSEGTFGSEESEITSPRFFFSEDGGLDPKEELLQSISSFFKEASLFPPNAHPQCRFPARFNWLKKELQIASQSIPKVDCPLLNEWLRRVNPSSLTLVFPSYYFANPASMFGHTLLRINSAKFPNNPVLGYAINYAAKVDFDKENSFKYAIWGLFGGYPGYFSLKPYYLSVTEYSDIETRDIWEYDLNFTKAEITNLLLHTWELEKIPLDYYFLKGNCSYHLLSLLEAARPSLDLRSQFNFWAIPSDTLRAVLDNKNILKKRSYRPSRMSEVLNLLEFLPEKNQSIFFETIAKLEEEPSLAKSSTLLSQVRDKAARARLLEVLGKYYVLSGRKQDRTTHFEVLKRRAKIDIIFPPIPEVERTTPPELGHPTSRAAIKVGQNSELNNFQELELRLSMHDFMASDLGFLPYSQVEFYKFRFRNYSDKGTATLEEFVVSDIRSFTPDDRLKPRLDWRGYFGIQRPEEKNCLHCKIVEGNLLLGESYQFENALLYVLIGGEYKAGEVYQDFHQVNAMINTGVIFKWKNVFKVNLDYLHFYDLYGEEQNYDQFQFELSYIVNREQDLRVKTISSQQFNEQAVSWQLYF